MQITSISSQTQNRIQLLLQKGQEKTQDAQTVSEISVPAHLKLEELAPEVFTQIAFIPSENNLSPLHGDFSHTASKPTDEEMREKIKILETRFPKYPYSFAKYMLTLLRFLFQIDLKIPTSREDSNSLVELKDMRKFYSSYNKEFDFKEIIKTLIEKEFPDYLVTFNERWKEFSEEINKNPKKGGSNNKVIPEIIELFEKMEKHFIHKGDRSVSIDDAVWKKITESCSIKDYQSATSRNFFQKFFSFLSGDEYEDYPGGLHYIRKYSAEQFVKTIENINDCMSNTLTIKENRLVPFFKSCLQSQNTKKQEYLQRKKLYPPNPSSLPQVRPAKKQNTGTTS